MPHSSNLLTGSIRLQRMKRKEEGGDDDLLKRNADLNPARDRSAHMIGQIEKGGLNEFQDG
jgi:hypothetical protein